MKSDFPFISCLALMQGRCIVTGDGGDTGIGYRHNDSAWHGITNPYGSGPEGQLTTRAFLELSAGRMIADTKGGVGT